MDSARSVPDGPLPSLLMVLSVVGLWVTLAALLLLPLPAAMVLGTGIYAALAIAELSAHVVSPITLASLLLFMIGATAILGGWDLGWLPYGGSLFLGSLFLLSAALLLFRRPFTTFYSAGRGHRGKHWLVSGMWTLAYLLGAVLAWALMPRLSFVIVPMILVALTGALTLWLNLVWFGKHTRRAPTFELDGFRFSEIGDDPADLATFYDLAAKEFWPSIRQSPRRGIATLAQLRERLAAGDRPYDQQILRFVAWKGSEPVGTICCVLDGSTRTLPVEEESGRRLDSLRALGGVMEIGKFAIAGAYRTRQPVFLGLLRCAIEVAMERRVPFIANDSYRAQTSLYKRIGFEEVGDEPFEDSNGALCTLLVLNLSRAVVHESSRADNSFMSRLIPLLNGYLTERCYHRLSLGFIIKPRARRPFEVSGEALQSLAHGVSPA